MWSAYGRLGNGHRLHEMRYLPRWTPIIRMVRIGEGLGRRAHAAQIRREWLSMTGGTSLAIILTKADRSIHGRVRPSHRPDLLGLVRVSCSVETAGASWVHCAVCRPRSRGKIDEAGSSLISLGLWHH